MKILFDPVLVENALTLFLDNNEKEGDFSHVLLFRGKLEDVYGLPDEQREQGFVKLHCDLFAKWGLGKSIRAFVEEQKALFASVEECFISQAQNQHEEGADFSSTKTKIGIKIFLPRFFDGTMEDFLNHEFMHLSDLLNENFGYDAHSFLGETRATQDRVTERYKILWDVTIDGRLERKNKKELIGRQKLFFEFRAAFNRLTEKKQEQVFEHLWSMNTPSHAILLDMARTLPGLSSVCPLCSFPTVSWADAEQLTEKEMYLIAENFQTWKREDGCCGRCAEHYRFQSSGFTKADNDIRHQPAGVS